MKMSSNDPDLSAVRPPQATRWSLAAATGLLLAGCPDRSSPDADNSPPATPNTEAAGDKECCMGKNDCKGKGGCAVPESNDCAGKNECKGKGGCNMHCPK
jgi:hypothetical protein